MYQALVMAALVVQSAAAQPQSTHETITVGKRAVGHVVSFETPLRIQVEGPTSLVLDLRAPVIACTAPIDIEIQRDSTHRSITISFPIQYLMWLR